MFEWLGLLSGWLIICLALTSPLWGGLLLVYWLVKAKEKSGHSENFWWYGD